MRRRLPLWGLILAGLALRFWRIGDMPLFGDEAYYLLWLDHPAPGYFDHPAGVALLLRLSTLLGGLGETGVRWLNALLSAACVALAWGVGRAYVSRRGGLSAAAAVALGPVYILTGRVVYPDALHDTLLLLSLLVAAPLLIGPKDASLRVGRWALFGLTLALMSNVKLSTGFFFAALALYIALRRRDLLRRPGPWLACAIAGAGAAPIIVWNLAHDWGMVRLALQQGANFGLPTPSLPATWLHAARYLTPPAALLAIMAGAGLLRRARAGRRPPACAALHPSGDGPQFLALAAACTLLPILLSAADSPRNLGFGLLCLWPLAGLRPPLPRDRPAARRISRLADGATAACLLGLGVYAIGTVGALLGPPSLPHSVGAPAIRRDAMGWPNFAREVRLPEDALIFAVDYSIAGQIRYYTGRSVYSAAPQFRAWGVPAADRLVVLSQGFAPPGLIEERLRTGFETVSGPEVWTHRQDEVSKRVAMWTAAGRRAGMEGVVTSLDYLALAVEATKDAAFR